LKFSKRRRAVPPRPIWTIMVAAKLDHSRVLVTKFCQNRSTLTGRSAGQRHRDTQRDRQTRLKIMALQVCNRANSKFSGIQYAMRSTRVLLRQRRTFGTVSDTARVVDAVSVGVGVLPDAAVTYTRSDILHRQEVGYRETTVTPRLTTQRHNYISARRMKRLAIMLFSQPQLSRSGLSYGSVRLCICSVGAYRG